MIKIDKPNFSDAIHGITQSTEYSKMDEPVFKDSFGSVERYGNTPVSPQIIWSQKIYLWRQIDKGLTIL